MSVQQQRRPGTGLQILSGDPVDGDSTVVDDNPARFLGR
jgi:hypothetical protein